MIMHLFDDLFLVLARVLRRDSVLNPASQFPLFGGELARVGREQFFLLGCESLRARCDQVLLMVICSLELEL